MINSPVERADKAVKNMAEFVVAMKDLSQKLNRKFLLTDQDSDQDSDQVSFELDNYPFTLGWGETTRPCIGGVTWIVEYNLCIWHTTMGSRFDPPESIDKTLIVSQSVADCVRVAFETVAKEEIRATMEGYSYAQMAKEEVTEDW